MVRYTTHTEDIEMKIAVLLKYSTRDLDAERNDSTWWAKLNKVIETIEVPAGLEPSDIYDVEDLIDWDAMRAKYEDATDFFVVDFKDSAE
jgi:hypothetical protein